MAPGGAAEDAKSKRVADIPAGMVPPKKTNL